MGAGWYLFGNGHRTSAPVLPALELVRVDDKETIKIDEEGLARFAAYHDLPAIPDLTRLSAEAARAIHGGLQGVTDDPDDTASFGHLGRVFQSHRFLSEAIACYARAMALAPGAYEWAYHLGHAHAESHQPEPALEAYQRAAGLKPDYAHTFRALGELYHQSGDMPKAKRAFERFIALQPRSSHGYVGLARIAFDRQAYDTAAERLTEALARDEQDHRAHHLLGQTYQQLGRHEEAAHHLATSNKLAKRTIIGDPLYHKMIATNTTTEALGERMRAAMRAGQPHEAIRLGEELCRRHPTDAGRLHNLALVYKQARRYPEALDRIEKAIASESDDLAAHGTKAELLLLLRRTTEAIELLDRIVARDPDSYSGHYYRGVGHMMIERAETGVASFREAVRVRDGSVPAHLGLAKALEATGRRDEALAEYRRVLELDPSNGEAIERIRGP